jgi:hypothetical protein
MRMCMKVHQPVIDSTDCMWTDSHVRCYNPDRNVTLHIPWLRYHGYTVHEDAYVMRFYAFVPCL